MKDWISHFLNSISLPNAALLIALVTLVAFLITIIYVYRLKHGLEKKISDLEIKFEQKLNKKMNDEKPVKDKVSKYEIIFNMPQNILELIKEILQEKNEWQRGVSPTAEKKDQKPIDRKEQYEDPTPLYNKILSCYLTTNGPRGECRSQEEEFKKRFRYLRVKTELDKRIVVEDQPGNSYLIQSPNNDDKYFLYPTFDVPKIPNYQGFYEAGSSQSGTIAKVEEPAVLKKSGEKVWKLIKLGKAVVNDKVD